MATKVIMPQLGESVVEGTVTRWLKQPGDDVQEFEPLVEINTDKVDTEVPSPASGVVLKVYVEEGETVEAGRLLAVIGKAGEAAPEPAEGATQKVKAPPAKSAPPNQAEAISTPTGRSKDLGFISPVVARMASEHHLDLSRIEGTGRGGRITKKDVQAYLEKGESGAPAAAPWEEPASGELFRPSEEVFGPASGWRGEGGKGKSDEVEPLGTGAQSDSGTHAPLEAHQPPCHDGDGSRPQPGGRSPAGAQGRIRARRRAFDLLSVLRCGDSRTP